MPSTLLRLFGAGLWCAASVCLLPSRAPAATTIDATNRFAYSANLGWIDWRGDTNAGAVIGEYVCSGFLYAANVGWINLGSGTPANGIQYQNNAAGDFGINQDGLGNLRGYAWGANIGWINFEATGAPQVDLRTGLFSGYAWSANCGWISLSNAVAVVQTDSIRPAPLAPNGLPVAWLLQNFGTTNVNAQADADGDGMSNAQEYLAGTDPNNPASVLKITSVSRGNPTPDALTLTWNAVPTRFYTLQQQATVAGGLWTDLVFFGAPGANSAVLPEPNPTNDFFRIRAFRPLMP